MHNHSTAVTSAYLTLTTDFDFICSPHVSTDCLSQCSVAVKRHDDHTYKTKHLIGRGFTVSEASSIIVKAGSMVARKMLEQSLRATS